MYCSKDIRRSTASVEAMGGDGERVTTGSVRPSARSATSAPLLAPCEGITSMDYAKNKMRWTTCLEATGGDDERVVGRIDTSA
jgi:hypothetical protein